MTQQPDEIAPGENYTVQAGDTLKSIAMRAYHDPNKWMWIYGYDANKQKIGNDPGLLPHGIVLYIPDDGGKGGGIIHQ